MKDGKFYFNNDIEYMKKHGITGKNSDYAEYCSSMC